MQGVASSKSGLFVDRFPWCLCAEEGGVRERRLRRICAGAAELQWLAALPAVPGPIRPTLGDQDLKP